MNRDECNAAIASDGRKMEPSHSPMPCDRGEYPATGKRRRRTEKTRMRIMEDRKSGTEADNAAKAVTAALAGVFLSREANDDTMAAASDITRESRLIESVTGTLDAISPATSEPAMVSPHLPDRKDERNTAYRIPNGFASPCASLYASTASSPASSGRI